MGNSSKIADALLGGWQLSGHLSLEHWFAYGCLTIRRKSQWATNWEVQSNATPTMSVSALALTSQKTPPRRFSAPAT